MFRYQVTFWLSDETKRKKELLSDHNGCIEEAKRYYNDVSGRAKNTKRIVDLAYSDNDKELLIVLESASPLAKPSLALQVFSGYLANRTVMRELVRNKALFRGSACELEQFNDEELSDSDMLKYLIDVVLAGKKQDEKMVEEIKKIIVEHKKG